jgi:hypothetical protein
MSNPAGIDDVESRWRPLTADENIKVSTRLDDAWRKLRRILPDLDARLSLDSDLAAEAAQVIADATIRLLENPRGHTKGSVTLDDRTRSWETNSAWSKGEIYFTTEELDGLRAVPTGGGPRAFSVMPS